MSAGTAVHDAHSGLASSNWPLGQRQPLTTWTVPGPVDCPCGA